MRLFLSASLALLSVTYSFAKTQAFAEAQEKPRQLVIISFDGAHDNRLWDRSRKLARKTGAHFTYFLSCTYLVNPRDRHAYRAPRQKPGRSNTGWALSVPEVQARLGNIWQAHLEGHEIGSHACGHFDGKAWTKAEWKQEFNDFDHVLLGAWKNNDFAEFEPKEWVEFVENDIKGFRAPYLSVGSGLVPALKAKGFTYDASLISKGPATAERTSGITRFALPRIPEGPEGRLVIGMDYNLYVRHSAGLNSPGRAKQFEARTLDAFRHAFKEQYDGNRVPLQLGFHFVEMNGGAYWDALDAFLTETCGKPDVACVNYAQAMEMMKGKKADGSAF